MQRQTMQRQIILKALKELSTHPTIEEIYADIYKEYPTISKTTIYRNLRQLAAKGIIRRASLLDGLERYEERTDQHYHFKCKNCGSIFDVEIGYLEGINSMVQKMYGFEVYGHDVVFSGVCTKCK